MEREKIVPASLADLSPQWWSWFVSRNTPETRFRSLVERGQRRRHPSPTLYHPSNQENRESP